LTIRRFWRLWKAIDTSDETAALSALDTAALAATPVLKLSVKALAILVFPG
jgi:hypothetical protein